MTRSQVAINGLSKALDFSHEIAQQSKIYKNTREQVEVIQRQAADIYLLTSQILGQVDLEDPKQIVVVPEGSIEPVFDIESLSEDEAKTLLCQMFNQVNISNNQTVVVAQTANFYNSQDSSQSKSIDLTGYLKDFKRIVRDTSRVESFKFTSKVAHTCARLCGEFFTVRFDRRNDLMNVHKFSQSNLNEYLASCILGYSYALVNRCEVQFLEEFDRFVEAVKDGGCKYTFPKSIGYVFFQVIHAKNYSLFSDETYQIALELWDELWGLGYLNFDSLDVDVAIKPTREFACSVPKLTSKLSIQEGLRLLDSLGTLEATSNLKDYDDIYVACTQLAHELHEELYVQYDNLKSCYTRYLNYRQYMGEQLLADLAKSKGLLDLPYEHSQLPLSFIARSFIYYVNNNPENMVKLENHVADLEQVANASKESKLKDNSEEFKATLLDLDPWYTDLFEVFAFYSQDFEC